MCFLKQGCKGCIKYKERHFNFGSTLTINGVKTTVCFLVIISFSLWKQNIFWTDIYETTLSLSLHLHIFTHMTIVYPGGPWWSWTLCKDGTQWHWVRRHAADLWSLPRDERRAGDVPGRNGWCKTPNQCNLDLYLLCANYIQLADLWVLSLQHSFSICFSVKVESSVYIESNW